MHQNTHSGSDSNDALGIWFSQALKRLSNKLLDWNTFVMILYLDLYIHFNTVDFQL